MKYKINSSLIESSWFEEAVFETIRIYENNENLYDSPLAKFYENHKTWGGAHKSMIGKELSEGVTDRLDDFVDLYNDIKKNGYDEKYDFLVYFDEDGFIKLYDGHHRLSILRYLNINVNVLINTEWDSKGIDLTGIKGKDFPLVEVAKSIFGREEMYQKIQDERLKSFIVQRPDSESRNEFIFSSLYNRRGNNSVLDIGCSEGYFCRRLTEKGFEVTGIENGYVHDHERGRKLIAITRYLSTIQSLKVNSVLGDWKDIIRKPGVYFDNILYLSVLHNEVNALGKEKAFENLKMFRGKTRRLLVEIPDTNVQKDWESCFEIKEMCRILERNTGMKVTEIYKGYRPIIVLNNEVWK